jgi:DUF4097 and DUF4098 domain-containing protein YvlB
MKTLKMLLSVALATAAFGQMQDNQAKQLSCENGGYDDRAKYCEMREQLVPAVGSLNVDAGRNGGATVKGWSGSEVLVRARVDSWGSTDAEAQGLAGQVFIDSSGGHVQASGPQAANNAGWAVSYEIFVPQATNLTVKTVNGGIRISDVRGTLRFEATNGGVHLTRLAGDVSGSTVNGGVNLELAGTTWDGNRVEVTTRNGGVNISVPQNYSAHFQTETKNGSLRSDFPLSLQGELRSRSHDFSLGGGGALIHVTTTNGGVKLNRL